MFIAMLKKLTSCAALGVALGWSAGLSLGLVALPVSAQESMHRPIDVVLFNYRDQQVVDVTVGGVRVGSAGRFPYSGRRTKVGAHLNDGAQQVSWRTLATDDSEAKTVTARNAPTLAGRTRETRFLSVHIYPDDSVDIKFSDEFPVYTPRGKAISDEYDRRKAQ